MQLRAGQIKALLDLKQVMQFYGVQFNNRGFARCCFHEEKTASMSVKNQYFKCFGCGAGGDVIAFTQKLFNITFPQAIVRLDGDFHLGLLEQEPDREEIMRRRAEYQQKAEQKQREQAEYMKKTYIYRAHWWAYTHLAPTNKTDEIDNRYVAAVIELPVLRHWFETHPWKG